jgi:hypothetical protein
VPFERDFSGWGKRDGMSEDEVEEFMDFNVTGA